jgi:ppGpp synthetase/RelA/SpoT-type nucleotidyltranferase
LIAIADGKPIEIQVRTVLQHLWAEFSEKVADLVDPAIKYGGGAEDVREPLSQLSNMVKQMEESELRPAGADLQQIELRKSALRQSLEMAIVEVSKLRSRS